MKHRFVVTRVSGAAVKTDDLKADLRRVAEETGSSVLSQKAYRERGRFDVSTVERRFGTWNKAMTAAGLEGGNTVDYSDAALFENLMSLWEHYGRQPRRAELAFPPSVISQSPYRRRFRSWIAALEQFASYANDEDFTAPASGLREGPRSCRDPSLRLRFRVLQRDNFRCRACGRSPALLPGLQLHVDHIAPWSAGGETNEDNLQTLCEPCNLGKGGSH